MQSAKNQEAAKALKEKKAQVMELLNKLKKDVAKSGDKQHVDWGDVGGMAHVLELLNEVDGFVNGTAK